MLSKLKKVEKFLWQAAAFLAVVYAAAWAAGIG